MLFNDSVLAGLPVGSIRSSGRIGTVTGVVINPNDLHIDALKCRVAGGKEQLLMPMDIRDLSPRGVVINDHENLIDFEDAIRLRPIIKINYELKEKVAYLGKRRVGKVDGYAVDAESLYINKIYIRPGIIARVNSDRLTFDRSAIKEVTDTKVIFESNNRILGKVKEVVPKLGSVAGVQPSAIASFTSENE